MKNFVIAALSCAVLFPSAALAETAEERGLAIAREADRRDSGWGDLQVDVSMTLKTASGREVVRRLRTRSIEVAGDGDRTLTIFDQPRDVKGTAFLSFTHRRGSDDQWLYLPALRRVKRISSSNRSGSFMGSEFAYEDITSEELERYGYRYLREEDCGDGIRCHVIARFPVDKSSGYTKQIAWYDTAHYRPIKTEYYDRKGTLVKVLVRSGYRRYGKFWRASRWEMRNVQTKKSTEVAWKGYRFGTGLSERDFDKNALKRAK